MTKKSQLMLRVDASIAEAYRQMLASRGASIQEDLERHIASMLAGSPCGGAPMLAFNPPNASIPPQMLASNPPVRQVRKASVRQADAIAVPAPFSQEAFEDLLGVLHRGEPSEPEPSEPEPDDLPEPTPRNTSRLPRSI